MTIGIAGFLADGYILTAMADMFGLEAGLVIYIIGGLIGLALVIFLFDWAIITLSSLAGTALLVQASLAEGGSGGVIFTILFLIGVIVQGSVLRNEQHS